MHCTVHTPIELSVLVMRFPFKLPRTTGNLQARPSMTAEWSVRRRQLMVNSGVVAAIL